MDCLLSFVLFAQSDFIKKGYFMGNNILFLVVILIGTTHVVLYEKPEPIA